MSTAEAIELQRRIRGAIPLSEAMGYRITELADTRIAVEAPLGPNINIHGTGFAGSLYALGILTAWGLCTHVITAAGLEAELVVAEASIRYRTPVRGDIVCASQMTEEVSGSFVDGLIRRKRARVQLEVEIGEGPAALIQAVMYARRA